MFWIRSSFGSFTFAVILVAAFSVAILSNFW